MVKKIVLLILLPFYILFFGEIFFRVLDPQPILPRYVTDGGDGIRANIPNSVYSQVTPEVDVEIRINAQGIRADRFISHKKKPNKFRIVLLGDSFFMGYEVNIEDSMAFLLEENLKYQGIDAEIVNLSVSGFGTTEHLIALMSRAKQFEPDLVIMQWHTTDPDDNTRSNLFSISNGVLSQNAQSYLPGISARDMLMKIPGYQWLIGNSHFYTALREKAALIVKDLLLTKNKLSEQTSSKIKTSSKNSIQLSLALIDEISQESENMGAEFVILDTPKRLSRTEFISAFSMFSKGALNKYTTISPLQIFKDNASSEYKLYYEQGHGHWTTKGNKLVAKHLSEELLSLQLQ